MSSIFTIVSDWGKKSALTLFISFIASTIYLIFGALLFSAFEQPEEVKRLEESKEDVRESLITFTEQLINLTLSQACPRNVTECSSQVNYHSIGVNSLKQLSDLLSKVGVLEPGKELDKEEIVSEWDFAGAFYFCITTVTTIGYGNVTPTMDFTRALTCVYAIIGIPIYLFTCSQFSLLFSYFFYKFRSILSVKKSTARRALYYTLCFFMIITFLFIIPVPMISQTSNISIVTAVYFLVVSLTTIGYGDIYPTDPNKGGNSSRVAFSFFLWVYMIIGLSLAGNLLNLIQSLIAKRAKLFQEKISYEVREVTMKSHNIHHQPDSPVSTPRDTPIVNEDGVKAVFTNDENKQPNPRPT